MPQSRDSDALAQAELQWMMDPDYLVAVDVAECGRLSLRDGYVVGIDP